MTNTGMKTPENIAPMFLPDPMIQEVDEALSHMHHASANTACTHTYTHIYTCTHTHTHRDTHTHTHIHMHVHTHPHTHTPLHTHTHTHIASPPGSTQLFNIAQEKWESLGDKSRDLSHKF